MNSTIITGAKEKAKNLTQQPGFDNAWLLFLCVICFGILIPWLGFYWDDLPYLYQYSVNGPAGFQEYVASDRPFSWWIFSFTTAIFGYNPAPYHFLSLILRWACGSVFLAILNSFWEKNRKINLFAASIFVFYPGFLQQPIALIYNHHWSVFLFKLLSIFFMIHALGRKKISFPLLIASVLLSLGMFSIENFATLELIRPVIIWAALDKYRGNKQSRNLIWKTFLYWLPYLLIFITFLVWRIVIFRFPTYKPSFINDIFNNPVPSLASLILRIPQDLITVLVRAWSDTFSIPILSDFGRAATYLFYGLSDLPVLLCTVVFGIKFINLRSKPQIVETEGTAGAYILAGLALFLLAGSIPWALDLPVAIEFAWDRMTIAFIPAVALIISGLLRLIGKRPFLQLGVFALISALAVGSHFQNGMEYKRNWDKLNAMLSQLSWRIPALVENTIVITSDVGLDYYSDNSLTSPINLLYSDLDPSDRLEYFVYFSNARSEDWFANEDTNNNYFKRYRSFYFEGNTSNAIALQFNPPECLKLLDRKFSNSITNPNLTHLQVDEIAFTNLTIIQKTPENITFPRPFQLSSSEDWCFYYQKADLARQFKDFQTIAQLGDEVIERGYQPRAASEWLPFLEGYLWLDDEEKTEFIIHQFQQAEDKYMPGLCYTLNRVKREPDFPFGKKIRAFEDTLNC